MTRSRRLPHPCSPALLHAACAGALLAGCISRGEPLDLRDDDGGSGLLPVGPPPLTQDASLPSQLAHSLTGVNPSNGAFKGGLRAIVRGTGFTSDARVWFADREVPAGDIVPIDPTRLQVIVPAGEPGAVDISVQNGNDRETRSTLSSGFLYDPFYAEPVTGPTSGGTRITLYGQGVDWTDETQIMIDGEPCEVLSLRSPSGEPQEIECVTPAGSPGSKAVTSENADGTRHSVLAAFTYSNSDNGFRGGLSGGALDGELQVLVLDAMLGSTLEGTTVLLGSEPSLEDGTLGTTDAAGVVRLAGDLGPTQTVTLVKECFQPITFVDVPVDRLTVYLEPVLSPACIPPSLDPPLVPGTGFVATASVAGELVWTGTREFEAEEWINVPPAGSTTQRRAAYLFELSSTPWRRFVLPRVSQAVTEEDQSTRGYSFRIDTAVGNLTLYALAGVEDLTQNPPFFQAYAMGLVRGVATQPLGTTRDVYINMDNTLDQVLGFEVQGPSPTPRGPDRVDLTVAVSLGNEGYAILPNAQRSALLPATGLEIVGLPPLSGSLQGAQYVSAARAFTGLLGEPPLSELGPFAVGNPSASLELQGFLEIPSLITPPAGSIWDGRGLDIEWASGGSEVSLLLVDVQSAGGLVNWRIVAPAQRSEFELPDLRALVPEGALEDGSLSVIVQAALLDDFDYGNLAYADLNDNAWRAFALDVFQVRY